MIFPILDGILKFLRAPLTYVLISMNVALFFVTAPSVEQSRLSILKLYDNEMFLKVQGHIFSRFIQSHRHEYSSFLQRMAEQAISGNNRTQRLLGHFALRDYYFMRNAESAPYSGDHVEYRYWKTHFREVTASQAVDPNTALGLSLDQRSWTNWLTYQFVHGGAMHLLANMLLLLVFGCAIESRWGSAQFLFIYLGTGVFAGGAFLALSSSTALPLVGASGAISGLMGFAVGAQWREGVRFLFFLMPLKRYYGFVRVPAWGAMIIFLLPDLTGILATLPEMGGVAHIAHVGGFLLGLFSGLLIFLWSKSAPQRILSHTAGL